MILIAASTSFAFKSCIFCSAIVAQLSFGDLADLLEVRHAGALLQVDRLLDQHRCRRRLGDEGERAVLVDGDLDRDGRAVVLLRLGVERLAEVHDVDAVLTERGTDRRGRVGLSARDLQLDQCHYLLGHCLVPL